MTWDKTEPGTMQLPSGRLIRGRTLQRGLAEEPLPTFGIYFLGSEPPVVTWDSRWVKWHDFWLPSDDGAFRDVLREAWERASHREERVELACGGGKGRTGTALACMAILDGVPTDKAIAYVRHHYHRRAVETPWQRRYVRRFNCPRGQ